MNLAKSSAIPVDSREAACAPSAAAPRGPSAPRKFGHDAKVAYLALLRAGHTRTAAAREVGVTTRLVALRRAGDAEFRGDCEEAEAEALEPIEQALYHAACRGEPWAVKLWLSNRGDSEGRRYSEKSEVAVQAQVAVGVATLTDTGELAGGIAALERALAERHTALALPA